MTAPSLHKQMNDKAGGLKREGEKQVAIFLGL